jgi:ATP-binding cassette subfamily B multidrug efflux pump
MGTLRYIMDLLLRYRYRYVLGVVFLLCVDTLQLIMPKILESTTNSLEEGTLTRDRLAGFAIAVVLVAVGIAVFRFLFRYTLYGVSRSIELSFRNRLYAHLQKLSVNFFNTRKTGDIMAHVTNDMNNVTFATGQGVIFAVDCLLMPVASLVMMLQTGGFRLTAASFAPIFALGVLVFFFMRVMHSAVQRQQEAFSNLTEAARENFSGIRVIKSFVQENRQIKRFERVNEANRRANLRFIRIMSLMNPSVMLVSSLSFVIALWYGGLLVIDGTITLGEFVAFNSYLGMVIWPITALGWVANIFKRGSVSLNRINALMDEKPEIADKPGAVPLSVPGTEDGSRETPAIEFRNLTFRYPGSKDPVLKDISFAVDHGKTLAIVGRTGSGKSTLVNLVPRLLSAPEGTLFINGVDINNISLSSLRNSIGCVPQDTFLFSDTIRNNIDFYRGFSMDKAEQAAKIASLHDDVTEFPKKFETIVGERGVTLSGGQKQRTAIARAVIGSPSILVLDDCLSAVDTKTEEDILRELKEIMKQRTCIIVSHRISAIRDADEIIVLHEGRIIERGTHDSLIGQKGYYYELYMKQLLADEIEKTE